MKSPHNPKAEFWVSRLSNPMWSWAETRQNDAVTTTILVVKWEQCVSHSGCVPAGVSTHSHLRRPTDRSFHAAWEDCSQCLCSPHSILFKFGDNFIFLHHPYCDFYLEWTPIRIFLLTPSSLPTYSFLFKARRLILYFVEGIKIKPVIITQWDWHSRVKDTKGNVATPYCKM